MADLELRKQRHPSFVPCRDYIFAMLLLIGMASYLYGLRVVILAAVSLATSIACDLLACLMRRTRWELTDLSSEMFALMYTLMLPASIGYGVAVLGTAVTVLLGKHAFGGYNCYPFHPAAFGFAFVSVCVGDALYQYPRPFSEIGLGLQSGAQLYSGVAQALRQGGVPNVDTTDLLLGQYAGPMGTTFCLIILSCLPMIFVGVVLTLLLTGKTFTFVAIVGALGLIGMVVKNGIVLMDEITLQLSQGVPPIQALVRSSQSRLRPVMMASLTTVLGMIPLLSDAMFGSMAVTIMGGLLFGTLITLLFIPVLYAMFFGIRDER